MCDTVAVVGRDGTTLTARSAAGAVGVADLMAVLRSHGPDRRPRFHPVSGTLSMPCMHGGGVVASSSSTARWVSDLGTDRHWPTATSAQCLALFKPARIGDPVDLGPVPDDHDDGAGLWWPHERMARRVMRDPDYLAPRIVEERDAVERGWVRRYRGRRDEMAGIERVAQEVPAG
jgi:secernin